MGEYIVPPDGKPLSNFAVAAADGAGPAHYVMPNMNLTKHKNPEFVIPTRNNYNPTVFNSPGPNAYNPTVNTGPDPRTKFTPGRRIKTSLKQLAGPSKIGPTHNVKNFGVGKDSLKFSMPRASRSSAPTGPPNHLVQPNETLGFQTPGPGMFLEDAVLPHSYHAAVNSRPADIKRRVPAPRFYDAPRLDKGLEKSMGASRKKTIKSDVPAPNKYDMGTSMGDGPAFSITMPLPVEFRYPGRGPSPTSYNHEREYPKKEKISFGFRHVSPEPDKGPAPNQYNIKGDTDKPKCAPCFKPKASRVIPSRKGAEGDAGPGPAAHDVRRDLATDNGPTFKRPHVHLYKGPRPGPADYGRVDVQPLSTANRAPAFSLKGSRSVPGGQDLPGPSHYRVLPLDGGVGVTIKGRQRRAKQQTFPSPNEYSPVDGVTRFGGTGCLNISLSGRHSNWRYQGLKRFT